MVEFHKDRLVEEEKTLAGISARDVCQNQATLGGMTPEQLVKQLRKPENISEFVRQLEEASQHGALTTEVVAECLRVALDDSSQLRQWYSRLDHIRDQLLLVNINLFDVMAEDQFYAIVDELVEQSWHRRGIQCCAHLTIAILNL